MAITYHAGRRVQGLSTEIIETPTIDDNFSTNNYSVTGSNIAVTNNEIQYSSSNDDSRLYRTITDIGNQDFVIDWVEKVPTGGTNHVYDPVVVAENNTRMYANSTNDGYTARTITKSGTNAVISPQQRISGTMTEGSQSTSYLTQGSTYYMRLSLDGTTLRQEAFSDADRTVSVAFDTITATAIPNLVSLQHGSQTTGSTLSNAVIDSLKVYYNISSLSSKPTNVQVGSRYEETDTRKMYHYNAPQAATDTTLFSSSSGWTGDTGIFTNSGDTMVWDTNTRGTAVVKSITNLSASGEWVMRFKITRVSGDLNDGSFLTIGSSSASTSTLARMQDGNGLYPYGIHVAYFANASYFYIGGSHDASFAWDFQSNANVAWSAGDSRWVEVSHASATAYTTKVYSNANFTGTPILTSVASPSSQTLDYDEFAIGTKWDTGRKNIIIEDMQIWTGVTTPPSADNTWSEEGT